MSNMLSKELFFILFKKIVFFWWEKECFSWTINRFNKLKVQVYEYNTKQWSAPYRAKLSWARRDIKRNETIGNQNGRKISNFTNSSASSTHPSANFNASAIEIQPGQNIAALIGEQNKKSRELETGLAEVFNIAPTVEMLRALNIYTNSPESMKMFALNQSLDLGERKLILNNGTPSVRIPISIPGTDQYKYLIKETSSQRSTFLL